MVWQNRAYANGRVEATKPAVFGGLCGWIVRTGLLLGLGCGRLTGPPRNPRHSSGLDHDWRRSLPGACLNDAGSSQADPGTAFPESDAWRIARVTQHHPGETDRAKRAPAQPREKVVTAVGEACNLR